MNNAKTTDIIGASVTRGGSQDESMSVLGHYTVECVGSDGQVKWSEDFDNLVTTQGKDHLLNNGLAGIDSQLKYLREEKTEIEYYINCL